MILVGSSCIEWYVYNISFVCLLEFIKKMHKKIGEGVIIFVRLRFKVDSVLE